MLNTEKATGPNAFPVKVIKLSANVIDSHLANILNKDIDLNCYSENAKVGNVTSIFKTDERIKVTNYQPVSFLNIISEIYERFINENLTPFANSFFSEFILAYKSCINKTNRKLEEIFRPKNGCQISLIDLYEAFDGISHDFLE